MEQHQSIHVFGDFDCDGVSGTAILVEALKSTGAKLTYSIPHRADDGHGIGLEAVQHAYQAGVHLGLSVDTGTTCLQASREAKRLGFDLIITDHHLPGKVLPDALALLNPARQDCGFADGVLCGTGVALFLLMATWKVLADREQRPAYDLKQLLDRVAMATVADVMLLRGVNRILVHFGLKQLRTSPSVGMTALLDVAKVNRSRISVETIAFYLAPRINAAGRMAHGEDAMALLCTSDGQQGQRLASVLDTMNIERRKVEADTYKHACEKLNIQDKHQPLAVFDEAWHAGVVGLVAGRLARQYERPAAVGFQEGSGLIRVSLRGASGFHIGDLLQSCAEYLLGFGGHAGAGGGTVKEGAWLDFVGHFQKVIQEQQNNRITPTRKLVDGVLSLRACHHGLASRLQRFEPVGQGNPGCLWVLQGVSIVDVKKLKSTVCRIQLSDGHQYLQAVLFRGGSLLDDLQQGVCVSLLGQLKLDDFRGGDAVQFVIEDVVLGDS
ncbi:MAG: DHHA1 domain-containing protein [Ghiorsea sp.]|nr:DHHA1 domain-containing protein [Ghiorsea sp.]